MVGISGPNAPKSMRPFAGPRAAGDATPPAATKSAARALVTIERPSIGLTTPQPRAQSGDMSNTPRLNICVPEPFAFAMNRRR